MLPPIFVFFSRKRPHRVQSYPGIISYAYVAPEHLSECKTPRPYSTNFHTPAFTYPGSLECFPLCTLLINVILNFIYYTMGFYLCQVLMLRIWKVIGIPIVDGSFIKAFIEPTTSLFRCPMGKAIGNNISLRLFLQSIISDGPRCL